MTEQEAIKKLKGLKHLFTNTCEKIDENTALDMAISALEKQVAKKPLEYDDCEKFIVRCTCGKVTDTRFSTDIVHIADRKLS